MTTGRELAEEFLNSSEQGQRCHMERVFVLMLIHDMLPFDPDQRGMTPREIGELLGRSGFKRNYRTIQRDLDDLMQVARVYYDAENAKPRRYHRLHDQRLTDGLPDPVRRVARYTLDSPDWPSQINVGR